MQPPDTEPVLDPGVIAGLRELGGEEDPGLLVELIDLFLADAPAHLERLAESLAHGDAGGLERSAHTLKSSSANIGALYLSSLCRQLEAAGKHAALEGSRALVRETQQHFEHVRQALEALRD